MYDCLCGRFSRPAQGPQPASRPRLEHCKLGDGGSGRVRLAPAHGSGNAAASGAEGPTRGAAPPQWRGCATAVATAAQYPALGRRETGISADALRAPHTGRCPLSHRRGIGAAESRRPTGGLWWIGLRRATPALSHRSGKQQRHRISACHRSGNVRDNADCRNV